MEKSEDVEQSSGWLSANSLRVLLTLLFRRGFLPMVIEAAQELGKLAGPPPSFLSS